MTENEPVMVINNLFVKANNGHKFIGGIVTKYYFFDHYWFIFGHYCSIYI